MANRIQRMRIQALSFTNHQGHAARLVFRGRASCPLLPLYAFAIYFTHTDASPDNVDLAALFSAINRPSGTLEIRLDEMAVTRVITAVYLGCCRLAEIEICGCSLVGDLRPTFVSCVTSLFDSNYVTYCKSTCPSKYTLNWTKRSL
ncbi:hypothetical protein BDW66DRAFT_135574 [Aspergillus desertorum]